jgi:hypothetical protein
MTVEPFTVWAAFGTFVFGMLVGVLIVPDEVNRARRRGDADVARDRSCRGGTPRRA